MGISKNRAAFDLGTNSFRMLIADVSGSTYQTLAKELCTVRLGEAFSQKGLTDAAQIRGLAALTQFKNIVATFDDIEIIACGTAVLRKPGTEHFHQRAEDILGASIKILTPEREAFLSRLGCLSGLSEKDTSCVTIDVGGGSSELSFAHHNETSPQKEIEDFSYISIPIGAVNLTERYLSKGPRSTQQVTQLRQDIQQRINKELTHWKNTIALKSLSPTLIASGGTATALACLDLDLTEYDAKKVQGHQLQRDALASRLERLTKQSPQETNKQPGLDKHRGEIILAGALLLAAITDFFNCSHLTITDTGLLEGILLGE